MRTIDCTGSSNLQALSYDEDTEDLDVTFKSGRYVYHGVSKDLSDELEQADSKGAFIARLVKPFHQVTKL